MRMQISDEGLQRLAGSEAFRSESYQDGGGVWTVGYGHTGKDVYRGMIISQTQALAFLRQDSFRAATAVNNSVHVTLTQHQFDALVDFAFNIGVGAFEGSTVLKLLNAGNFTGADADFMQWIDIHHVPSEGLINRRKSEQQEFEEK